MTQPTPNLFEPMLDSLPQQIALMDKGGDILWVNQAWKRFAAENGGPPDHTWAGTNYLNVCRTSSIEGDSDANAVYGGINSVIAGEAAFYEQEYPCHSPTEKRWFNFSFRPLERKSNTGFFVAAHNNITERVLAEQEVRELAIKDGLTGLANRRQFDAVLEEEWRRAQRLGSSLSLILFDVDNFKGFNDAYGHPAGDDCLRRIARAIKNVARRPGDLVARYGGEEIAILLCDSTDIYTEAMSRAVRDKIHSLKIPHAHSTDAGIVTVSGGIALMAPSLDLSQTPECLIAAADEALYKAKQAGRNQFVLWTRDCHAA